MAQTAQTAQDIVTEIRNYVAKSGYTNRKHWYVGIASDPRIRLFSDHNVDENNGLYIGLEAINANHAREAEASLLQLGYDGGTGGDDYATKHVYVFLQTPSTRR